MLKKMNKIALCGVLSGLLVLNSVGMVFAVGDLTPDAVVTGGSLGISALTIGNFGGVALIGTTQTTVAEGAVTTLTDSRGSGAGWNVTLEASFFTLDTVSLEAAAAGAVGVLPADSLVLGGISIVEVADTGSTPITASTTIAVGAIDKVGGVKILSTTVNNGMGQYTISVLPMTLTLYPKTTYAGTYTSTVTQTITSGPGI